MQQSIFEGRSRRPRKTSGKPTFYANKIRRKEMKEQNKLTGNVQVSISDVELTHMLNMLGEHPRYRFNYTKVLDEVLQVGVTTLLLELYGMEGYHDGETGKTVDFTEYLEGIIGEEKQREEERDE